jgi:hypothetical protein
MSLNISRYNKVQIGAPNSPLPIFDLLSGKTGALANYSSTLNFYTLLEDRSRSGKVKPSDETDTITVQERLYADLMRSLPTRGMLPHLVHELVERDPSRVDWDQHSFVCRYVGPPSIGKSFMIKHLGKLTHPKGCLYLNCKDVDMGTLFCETVFDTSSANKEKAAIDAKLLQGNANPSTGMKPENLEMLRHALGDAYVEEEFGGKTLISIDWNGITVRGDTPEKQGYHRQVIRETIKQVCENEGIKISSDLGQIGITTRDGIAIRAADPRSADYGRPVLLDEFMRCKPGTAQKLYEFIALLSDPRVEKLEVIGGENKPFTFYRKDLPLTYRVNMTDNPAVRGMGSSGMDAPLTSRLGVELDTRTVPDPGLHDYADRIAQALTGVPLMQIYYSAKDYFDQNPTKLPETAKTYRLRGLTDVEQQAVPPEELANIEQSGRIILISEQLAEFFAGLKPLFNPESPLHSQQGLSISHEYEDYLRGIEVDLRLVTKLLEKASVLPPEMTGAGSVNYALAFQKLASSTDIVPDLQDRMETRGTRLENYALRWLHQVLVPADIGLRGIEYDEAKKLYDASLKHAANSGIGDPSLREASRGGIKRISELYDVNLLAEPDQQIRILRDIIVDGIRKDHDAARRANPSDMPPFPDNNDKVIALSEFQLALKHAKRIAAFSTPIHTSAFAVPASSIDESGAGVLKPSIIIDLAAYDRSSVDIHDLATKNSVLVAIAGEQTRTQTMTALWNQNFGKIGDVEVADPTLEYAAGKSASGFAVTTLLVAEKDKAEPLHIVKTPDNRFIIVARDIDPRFKRLLKKSPIILVDLNTGVPAKAIDDLINNMTPDTDPENVEKRKRLKDAFLFRNGRAEDESVNRQKTLGELASSPELVPPVSPMAVTNFRNPSQIQSLKLRQLSM